MGIQLLRQILFLLIVVYLPASFAACSPNLGAAYSDRSTYKICNTKGQNMERIKAKDILIAKMATAESSSTLNLLTNINEPGKESTFTYDVNGNQLGKVVMDLTP